MVEVSDQPSIRSWISERTYQQLQNAIINYCACETTTVQDAVHKVNVRKRSGEPSSNTSLVVIVH